MLSIRENFFETIKQGGKPDRLVNQWEPFELNVFDPVFKYTMVRKKGESTRDRFGTLIVWPEDQIAGMPHVTEDDKVVPDITKWRDYVNVPDLAANCGAGWEEAIKVAEEIRAKGLLSMPLYATGVFEQLHFLMGFEDTLMNFLLEPEAMHELCEVIGDYRLAYVKLLVENAKPDIILSHDDWGSKHSLFMAPETWREFIKPQYKKVYSYLKENGVLIMHHSDSFLEPIVEDMIELGIDIWQGALPENDLLKLQKQINGRMTMMGGIDVSLIDHADSPVDAIKAETRRAIEAYTPGGNFIVAATYGGPNDVIYPQVKPAITEAIDEYNKEKFGI